MDHHFPLALVWTAFPLTWGCGIKNYQNKVLLVYLIYCLLTFGFEVKKEYLGGTSVWLSVYFFDSLANIY